MKVIWSPNALERLAEYAEYIALDNPIAAENWVNNLKDPSHIFELNLFRVFSNKDRRVRSKYS